MTLRIQIRLLSDDPEYFGRPVYTAEAKLDPDMTLSHAKDLIERLAVDASWEDT